MKTYRFWKYHNEYKQIKNKGFTLIEVLIALAIVSVGILGILASITQSVQNQSRLQEIMIATWIAENRIAYLHSLDDEIKASSGAEDMAGRRWTYRQKVQNTSNPNLKKVTIEVFSDNNRNNTAGTYTTFIANPIRELLE